MRQSSLPSTPLFADWLFTGKVELDAKNRLQILSEIKHLDKTPAVHGYTGSVNNLGPNMQKLRVLIARMFDANACAHFGIDGTQYTCQSTDAQIFAVKTGQELSFQSPIKRWYQCVVFLDAPKNGSNLILKRDDVKAHTTPKMVQAPTTELPANNLSVYFWPAHLSWGLTINESQRNTIVMANTFVIVKDVKQQYQYRKL